MPALQGKTTHCKNLHFIFNRPTGKNEYHYVTNYVTKYWPLFCQINNLTVFSAPGNRTRCWGKTARCTPPTPPAPSRRAAPGPTAGRPPAPTWATSRRSLAPAPRWLAPAARLSPASSSSRAPHPRPPFPPLSIRGWEVNLVRQKIQGP